MINFGRGVKYHNRMHDIKNGIGVGCKMHRLVIVKLPDCPMDGIEYVLGLYADGSGPIMPDYPLMASTEFVVACGV